MTSNKLLGSPTRCHREGLRLFLWPKLTQPSTLDSTDHPCARTVAEAAAFTPRQPTLCTHIMLRVPHVGKSFYGPPQWRSFYLLYTHVTAAEALFRGVALCTTRYCFDRWSPTHGIKRPLYTLPFAAGPIPFHANDERTLSYLLASRVHLCICMGGN